MRTRVGAVLLDAAAPAEALDDVTGSARVAEQAGLDSLWVGDHLVFGDAPLLDSTLTLAAAAAVTDHIELGTAVFLPSLRPLAWAAKQVATLSHLAGPGRLHLGVGAGAGPHEEYRAAGQQRAHRGRRTDAFLRALPDLLAGRPASLDTAVDEIGTGDDVDTRTVTLVPSAPMPTVWIGGSSPAALRRTTRFGDGWLGGLMTPEEFSRTGSRLAELADAAGRPSPRLGLVTHAAVGRRSDRSLLATVTAVLRSAYGLPQERAEQLAVAGSPARVADQLAEYAARGAEHLVVINGLAPWTEACDLLSAVAERLRGS